jgi:type IV pilus assembly protein PilM
MKLAGMFYRDKPLFGLDIGHASLKVMEIDKTSSKSVKVLGYGISRFSPEAIHNGEITNPGAIAEAAHQLFDKNIVGAINSRRVACSLPTSHTFHRLIKIPLMEHSHIPEAIHLEAEQYIPVPVDSLYLDYEIYQEDAQGIELLLVASPKKIVDSYLGVLEMLALEPVAFEPTISATSRLLKTMGDSGSEPSILIDIGSVTTDIAIFDKTLLVSSTVNAGGDTMTSLISKGLHLTPEQAIELKDKYGISFSEKQQRVMESVKPQLESLIHETQKSLRYHSERAAKSGKKISKIITLGGGSVMPGLNQYLSRELRLPTLSMDPWQHVSFGELPVPEEFVRSAYITAAGEALLNPTEVAV